MAGVRVCSAGEDRGVAEPVEHDRGEPGAGAAMSSDERYAWTAHPVRRRPQDLALAAAITLLSAWAIAVSLGSALLAALTVVILAVAIAPFYLPTHYVLDGEGVSERRLGRRRFRAWRELRRVEVGPGAALVSPLARRSWLDRYRGIVMYLDGADRAVVEPLLRARVAGAGAGASPSPSSPSSPPSPEATP